MEYLGKGFAVVGIWGSIATASILLNEPEIWYVSILGALATAVIFEKE